MRIHSVCHAWLNAWLALGRRKRCHLPFTSAQNSTRGFVPAGGEQDAAHVLARGHVHVRLAGKAVPTLAVELEEAGLVLAVFVEAVVGHHDAILRGEAALEVRPRRRVSSPSPDRTAGAA